MPQSKKRRKKSAVNQQTLYLGGFLLVLVLIIIFSSLSGCGANHGSATKVVESLLKAYGDGKEKMVKNCYGKGKEVEDTLQRQIDAMFSYIGAHEAKDIEVTQCDVLSNNGNTCYVYAIYELVIDKDNAYPCLGTYMVRKEGKKYTVVPPGEVTESMQKSAAKDFEKFMSTDIYKQFMVDYNTFIKRNPGYEERIAGKLGEV